MKKTLQLILLLLALATGAPLSAAAQEVHASATGAELKEVTVSVSNATVRIANAAGQRLEVYNMAGVKVATAQIDSSSKSIALDYLPKGCYILRIGNYARKVYLR